MPQLPAAHAATIASPWGPIQAAATDRGIIAVAMLLGRDDFTVDLGRSFGVDPEPDGRALPSAAAHLTLLTAELAAFFEGDQRTFRVPIDLRLGSDWDRLVLEGVRGIPFGSVASYGEVAARIGRFGAARAVGGAAGRNPIAILVPCHRVIAAGGVLGGYGGDWYGSREERLALKRDLLRIEGVVLADDPEPRSTHVRRQNRSAAPVA